MPGLYLSELTLSHFRSHKSARLALDARPVAIHGPNGAGKTNLIEAVSLLSPGRGLRRAAAQDMARRPESLGWKVTAILHSLHQVHEVEIHFRGRSGAAGAPRRQARRAACPWPHRPRALAHPGDGPALDRGGRGAPAVSRPDDHEFPARPCRCDARLREGHARAKPPAQGPGARRPLVSRARAADGPERRGDPRGPATGARAHHGRADAGRNRLSHRRAGADADRGRDARDRGRPARGAGREPLSRSDCRGARSLVRTAPISTGSMPPRACPPPTAPPASRRRFWSRSSSPMPARWPAISARRRSCSWTRSRPISMPPAARRSTTRSARWGPRPG